MSEEILILILFPAGWFVGFLLGSLNEQNKKDRHIEWLRSINDYWYNEYIFVKELLLEKVDSMEGENDE